MGPSTAALASVACGCGLAALFVNVAIALSGFNLTALGLLVNLCCAAAALALSFRVFAEDETCQPPSKENPQP